MMFTASASGCLRAIAILPGRIATEPALHLRRRPARIAIAVAGVARVRRADCNGEVRPRNAQTVIVPSVDYHIGCRGHVAGGAYAAVHRFAAGLAELGAPGR